MLTLLSFSRRPLSLRSHFALLSQTTRGPRTHNNNSTPYAKGRPTKNTIRDRESNPNHNRYGAIELIDKSSDGPRGLLSRIDGPSRDGPPGAGPSRSRPSRPNQDSRTNMKSINAEVKTMQRKAIPKYRPDLNTPEMTKWLAGRFKDGVLDMSVSYSPARQTHMC